MELVEVVYSVLVAQVAAVGLTALLTEWQVLTMAVGAAVVAR